MNKISMFAIACALFAGCAAQTAPQPEEVEGASEELRIGSFGVASCPGGGSPACVVCNGGCKSSCSGDYTCDTAPGVCSYSPGVCTTTNPTPSIGTWTIR